MTKAASMQRGEAPRRQRASGYMLYGLKEAREEAMYSLADLEEKSGVPAATISRLELLRRGSQGRTARKLAEALEVSVKELRGR